MAYLMSKSYADEIRHIALPMVQDLPR